MLPESADLEAAAVAEALLSVDRTGRIVGTNTEFERLLGYGPDAALGANVFELLAPVDADGRRIERWHRSSLLACVRGVPQTEANVTDARGRIVKAAALVAYRREKGEFAGGQISLRELAGKRLESTAAQAVATVAHEIRSPLTSIRGFASLLRNKGDVLDASDRDEMLDEILAGADRMTRLVSELLDVSRLEAGRLNLAAMPVNLIDTARLAVSGARGGVAGLVARADDIDVDISGDAAAVAAADPDKVMQIVVNLVENAMKYGEAPFGVFVARDADEATLEVRDHGRIDPVHLTSIFSKFFVRARTGRPSGTGLGLYISRGLAEAQGGTLRAESGPEGTSFRLTLPAH